MIKITFECNDCKSEMVLKKSHKGVNSGRFFYGCSSFPDCDKSMSVFNALKHYLNLNDNNKIIDEDSYNYKYSILSNIVNPGSKGASIFYRFLYEIFDDNEKKIFIDCLNKKMEDFISHYITCRIGYCYSNIFRYLLYDFLDNQVALDKVLKSNVIREDKGNVIHSNSGSKIYFDIFKDFVIVKSQNIRDYLKNEFPNLWEEFLKTKNRIVDYSFVDYNNMKLIDDGTWDELFGYIYRL